MECGGDVGWFEYRLSGTVKQKEEYDSGSRIQRVWMMVLSCV